MGFKYIHNIPGIDVIDAELNRIGYYKVQQRIYNTMRAFLKIANDTLKVVQ